MTFYVVERAPITSEINTLVKTLGFPVGDNSSPGAVGTYGWQDEPNEAGTNFTPWLVITAMPGQGHSDQSISSLAEDAFWLLSYSIFVAGVSRNQTEVLADRVRHLMANLNDVLVTGESASWLIDGARCVNLGSNNRVGEASPYYFTQTDSYTVWVTKG
jgi:hypothetical protein